MKTQNPVSDEKKEVVKDLVNLIKGNKTILVVSIKDIPASQFQEIGKKLRGKAEVRVPKKSMILRAIESSGNEELKKLESSIKESTAVLFSNTDSFELASELIEGKRAAKAKPGQEAPEDIEVPAGPTEMMAGPAVSEFGGLGIKIQIEGGKIVVREAKIIAKKGDKVTQKAADMMSKMDIKPFSIGLIPLAAFDTKEGKLYLNIKINREETLRNLKELFAKSLGFAVKITYVCPDTIKFILGKAGRQEKIIENLMSNHTPQINEGGN
ncbi:MAG: 50S ribosomal protein L10 [Nanoarchaeota archaeon]|nr:50S ribosomal protein L10 [Nanoarchaeota archaeon]